MTGFFSNIIHTRIKKNEKLEIDWIWKKLQLEIRFVI